MTIKLKNVSESRALTIRFGDGMNLMIQLNPGQEKPVPPALSKGLLQHYLSTYKGDLQVIKEDSAQSVKKETVENANEKPEEKTETPNDENSGNDESSTTENPGAGESTEEVGGEGSEEQKDDSDEEKPSHPEVCNDCYADGKTPSEEDCKNCEKIKEVEKSEEQKDDSDDEGSTEEGQGSEEGEQKDVITEEALKKMPAEEVKKLAASLGIEVTEDSTKKALIPVILNKQGN